MNLLFKLNKTNLFIGQKKALMSDYPTLCFIRNKSINHYNPLEDNLYFSLIKDVKCFPSVNRKGKDIKFSFLESDGCVSVSSLY